MQIDKILSNENYAKVQIIELGVRRFSSSRSKLTRLSKSDALNLAKPIDRQIIIRTQLLEVSVSKMRRLRIDISTFDGQDVRSLSGADVLAGASVADVLAGASVLGSFPVFMDALRQNGIVHLLAEPTITTMDRRRASISLGSTIEVGSRPNVANESETEFIGTKLEVVPQAVDSQRLYIELRLDWSGIDESSTADHGATPKICHRIIDTTIQATFGETFVLGGLVSVVRKGDQTEETTLVLMVTPEWADEKPADKKKPLPVLPVHVSRFDGK